ncbi:hypothetical protein GCM10009734_82340 [Nonomuraea bangladeshensis]
MHLAADRRYRPPAFVPTPGQAGDSPQFRAVLERITIRLPVGRARTRLRAVGAEVYSSRGNCAYLRRRRIKGVILEKTDQAANRKNQGSRDGRSVGHDAEYGSEASDRPKGPNVVQALAAPHQHDQSGGGHRRDLALLAAPLGGPHLVERLGQSRRARSRARVHRSAGIRASISGSQDTRGRWRSPFPRRTSTAGHAYARRYECPRLPSRRAVRN